MNAIAGIFRFGLNAPRPAALLSVLDSMGSGTADTNRLWEAGPIAFGSRGVCNTPEAQHELQPLQLANGAFTIVFDGRLDNREELFRDFDGFLARSSTDAGIALAAYDKWGVDAPSHLLGDFAFAVWDASRMRLFCATDSMGATSLYYASTASYFAFASTEEALLQLPGFDREPNQEFIAHLLVPQFRPTDTSATWLRGVNVLRPAESAVVTMADGVRLRTYAQIELSEPTPFGCVDEATEAFLAVFGMAVRDRLRSAGPVGQMLSGGIDSASIFATVQRSPPESFRTYSAVSTEHADRSETSSILTMTAGSPDSHLMTVPSFHGFADDQALAREAWASPHPRDNSILLPAMMCYGAAGHGEKVLLHGATGDVAVASPERYVAMLMRSGQWGQAWKECGAASVNHTYLAGSSKYSLFAANAWTALMPGHVRALLSLRGRAGDGTAGVLSKDLSSRLKLPEQLAAQARASAKARVRRSTPQEEQAQALRGPFGPAVGLSGFAKVGRRYGLEMRDPWGDRRVIEFFLGLDVTYKVRNGWTKFLPRTAFAPHLPPSVVWRTDKQHVGYHFIRQALSGSSQRLKQVFSDDLHFVSPYLDKAVAQAAFARYSAGAQGVNPLDGNDVQQVYEIAVLVGWLKRLAQRS